MDISDRHCTLRPLPPRSRFPPSSACAMQAEAATNVPPPQLVEPASGNREVAVLAGGCFWGVEAVYEHVKGVIDVRSGFAGGDRRSATYDKVSSGKTAPCRSGPDRLRSPGRQLWRPAPHLLLGRPRSDRGQPPGTGRRPAISIGHLPAIAGTGAGRPRLYRPAVEAACLQEADRNEDRARQLRRGGSLSSGLHGARTRRTPTSSSTTSRNWQR